tara:strand:- start:1656 stop:1928 length:273 start_codon:yes stop_codon:yes gene_type:complete
VKWNFLAPQLAFFDLSFRGRNDSAVKEKSIVTSILKRTKNEQKSGQQTGRKVGAKMAAKKSRQNDVGLILQPPLSSLANPNAQAVYIFIS